MTVYLDLVMGLNFGVDFLLLIGANKLCGYPAGAGRAALAAILGACYSALCFIRGLYFLQNMLWRLVFWALMVAISYGVSISAVRRGALFAILSMALGGIATGMEFGGFGTVLLSAAVLWLLCVLVLRGRIKGQTFVPVELCYGGVRRHILALMDTGNSLQDPVTGEQVLVVGREVAQDLLGLSREQLLSPIVTLQQHSEKRLRLIPYRTVGQSSGMLLAARMDSVNIAGKSSGTLVAFAPGDLGKDEGYQALAGGSMV